MAPKKTFELGVRLGLQDRLIQPLRRMNRRLQQLGRPIRRARLGLRRIATEAGFFKLTRSMGGAVRAARRVGSELFSVVGKLTLVAGVAAATGAALIGSFVSTADEISKTSVRLGIGADALQEMRFAGERLGITTSELDTGFDALARRMGELRVGQGGLVTFLQRSNPALLEQLKLTTGLEQALGVLLPSIQALADDTDKAALAGQAFGRSGVRLVNLANAAGSELADLRQEFRDLGGSIDALGLQVGVDARDAFTNLRAAGLGLRNLLAVELTPEVIKLSEELKAFVVENRPRVQAFAAEFARELPGRLERLRAGFRELRLQLQPLLDLGSELVKRFGLVKIVGATLAFVIGTQLVIAVGSLSVALGALSLVILSTPVGLFFTAAVLGATALSAVVIKLTEASKTWGEIWQQVVDSFNASFGPIFDKLGEFSGRVQRAFGRLFGDDDSAALPSLAPQLAGAGAGGGAGFASGAGAQLGEGVLRVEFAGTPPGTRVDTEGAAGVGLPIETDVGYQLG